MKRLHRFFIALAIVLAVSVLYTLAAPGVIHAVAAALVQVTNTVAAPAIVQSPPQLASQLVSMGVGFNGYGSTFSKNYLYQVFPDGSIGGYYKVPAGQSLVVTSIFVSPEPSYSTSNIEVMLVRDNATSGSYGYWMVSPATLVEIHPTGIVIGPGYTPMISVKARDNKGFNVGISVQGYLTAN